MDAGSSARQLAEHSGPWWCASARGLVLEIGQGLLENSRPDLQLDQVESALSGFGLGDERLRLAQQRSDFGLGQAGVATCLPELGSKAAVGGLVGILGKHEAPVRETGNRLPFWGGPR